MARQQKKTIWTGVAGVLVAGPLLSFPASSSSSSLPSSLQATALASLSGFSDTAALTELAGLNTLVRFDLVQRPLADALLEFTDLTGLALVFDSRLVARKIAGDVQGEYSAKVAIDLLLDGTGLTVTDVGGDTLAIIPARDSETRGGEHSGVGTASEGAVIDLELDTMSVMDELLVIGTRTSNPPYFKFKPSVGISAESVQFGGSINVSDFLFQLPAMLGDVTSANTTLFGTPAGLNLADLRGIGPERTMVLVNGRRFIPTYGGNQALYGVDLNAISASLVERIEVVSGGATTSFGGEAVAGMLNFKLRDDFEGWSIASQTGLADEGDREEFVASLTYGTKFSSGRGSLVASVTFDDQAGLRLSDRSLTATPSGYALDGRQVSPSTPGAVFTPGFGGSSLSGHGSFGAVLGKDGTQIDLDNYYVFNLSGTEAEPFERRRDQLYDYAPDQTLVTPIERIFGTLNAKYEISSGHRLVLENSYASTSVSSSLAPMPLFYSTGLVLSNNEVITVPLTNPYITDRVRNFFADIPDAESIILQRRMVELGPRTAKINRRTYRSMIGLQGMVAPEWSYDAYYQFGRSAVHEERSGLLDLLNYQAAVDPERCAKVEGCTVINPFGIGNITVDQANFIKAPNAERRLNADQHILSLAFAGPVDFLTSEPARLSFGGEYRYESLDDRPDVRLNERPIAGSLNFPGSQGSFSILELYGDITLPIVIDQPMLSEFTVTSGVRLSEASTVGVTANWHVGALWSPVPGYSLRFSYQAGSRSPNIAELYSAGPSNFNFVVDPCVPGASSDAVVLENCLADGPLGVGENFSAYETPVEYLNFGNPDLDAEKSTNLTFGFVFESEEAFDYFPGRLRLGIDAYRIVVRDYILPIDPVSLLFACYASENLSSPYCRVSSATGEYFIRRDETSRRLVAIEGTHINGRRYDLKGLDVDLQYVADMRATDWLPLVDTIAFTGRYTFVKNANWREETSTKSTELKGTAKFPAHKVQLGLSIGMGNVTLDWDSRFRSSVISAVGLEDLPDTHIRSIWYHDLSVRTPINNGRATLYGGVRNLFDSRPNRVFVGSVGDTFPEYYDTVGRRFFAGVVIDF